MQNAARLVLGKHLAGLGEQLVLFLLDIMLDDLGKDLELCEPLLRVRRHARELDQQQANLVTLFLAFPGDLLAIPRLA